MTVYRMHFGKVDSMHILSNVHCPPMWRGVGRGSVTVPES